MNKYQCDEDAVISFSGGRSSGFLLHKVVQAYDGLLPDHIKVIFCNTGKEMPQTLDFVEDCSQKWNVPIVWLEYRSKRKFSDKISRNLFKLYAMLLLYPILKKGPEESVL